MARGTLTFQPEEFLDHADRLATDCANGAALQVLGLLRGALPSTQHDPKLLRAVARLEHRAGENEQSARTWLQLLAGVGASQAAVGSLPSRYIHEAHAALALLFAQGEPLADPDRQATHALGAARTAADPEKALNHYLALVPRWTVEELGAEVEWIDASASADLAPRLVRAWLDVDPASRGGGVVCLVTTGRRWELWEEKATVALLNAVPQQLMASAPDLQFWQVDAWLRGVVPTDGASVAAAALTAMRDGWVPAPAALRRVCQLVFDELSEEEALAAISSSGLDRASLHDKAEREYRPESASAMWRWLTWFPKSRVAPTSEKALAALRLGCDLAFKGKPVGTASLRSRLLEVLRPIRDAAIGAAMSPEEAHLLWLDVCRRHPEEAGPYLAYLALAGAAASSIDAVLDLVLQDPGSDLRAMVAGLPSRPGYGSPRLQSVVGLVGLLERLERESDIGTAAGIETRHFAAIRRVFGTHRNEVAADIAVELINRLRRSLNPRWLTPVTDLIQALVAARRFEEAYRVSDEALSGYARGRLDIQGIPVEDYLARHCTGPSRPSPPQSSDYRRVIDSMTRRWNSLR
jgi:hypothetical protein